MGRWELHKAARKAFYIEVVAWIKSCTGRIKVSGPTRGCGWNRKMSFMGT